MSEWDKFWENTNWNMKWFDIPASELEEIKAIGDRMQKELQFLQKSVELLSAVRADWFHQHNELIVIVEQLKKDNEDLAKLAQEKTKKIEAIRLIAEEYKRLSLEDSVWGWLIPPDKILEMVEK